MDKRFSVIPGFSSPVLLFDSDRLALFRTLLSVSCSSRCEPRGSDPKQAELILQEYPEPPLRDFVRLKTDWSDTPLLELYEDWHRLGPSDSLPDLVRQIGNGAFSQRGRELLFSTSDGSSPLTNGRTYLVKSPLAPTPLSRWLGGIAFLIVVWRVVVLLPPAPRRSVRYGDSSHIFAGSSCRTTWWAMDHIGEHRARCGWRILVLPPGLFGDQQRPSTLQWAVSFKSVMLAVTPCVLTEFSMNVSQGSTHWSILANGVCGGRIYAAFLATILGLTGRSWFWMLLVQSALASLSLTVLLRATSRLAGPIVAIVIFWLMFSFSAENAYPATTTESAGLAMGAVGLALLLDSTRLGHQSLLFLGAACLSLALNARAGALFALPFLAVGVFFQDMPWRARLSATAIAMAGIVSGFAVQSFLIHHFGGTSGASHSNFAYTLYGLSVGGKGWSQVFNDHPELFRGNLSDAQAARLIFDLAMTNMVVSPWVIAKALIKNFFHYLRDPLLGVAGLRMLWWLGALAITARWRDLPYRIVGLMSLGVWLSSSVIIQDGGPRIFAATWGVTALQVALGVHLVLTWLGRIFDPSISLIDVHRTHPHPAEICLAVLLAAAIFLPLTPLRNLVSLDPVSPRGCMNGEKELIVRLGHESYMIVLVGDGQPKNVWQMQVSANDLRRGLKGAWFEEGFAYLPVPATAIHGYQLMSGEGQFGFGSDVRLVWRGDLGKLVGQTVSFCFRPDITVPVTDATYYLARSVRPLKP